MFSSFSFPFPLSSAFLLISAFARRCVIRTQATLMTASCPGVGEKDILADIAELMFQTLERIFPGLRLTGFLRTVGHSTDFERAPDSGSTRVPDSRIQRSCPETIRNSPLSWGISRQGHTLDCRTGVL